MKLIVGLGNIGKEYENTRHNIGFMVLDKYLGKVKFKEDMNALIYEMGSGSNKVIFIKPTTYMNNSGIAVSKVADYYNISVDDILVIQDDLDLMVGDYKVKQKSSSGGHNGIKSIINYLGTSDFARFKIGIGHNREYDTKDYVLGKFSKDELTKINEVIEIGAKAIDTFINEGIERMMNIYNTK